MASYQELFDLRRNPKLLDKVTVAIIVSVETIFAEPGGTPNHANRLIWAREASIMPTQMGVIFMGPVLAANKTVTVAQITDAADTLIQTNVDDTVDDFADGTAMFLSGGTP